ncbi:MAG: hypothetical protein IPL05_06575 [Betaproteobacteria bacterium]|nr:hypothetical protein [Betaproteobacteria bacterium]
MIERLAGRDVSDQAALLRSTGIIGKNYTFLESWKTLSSAMIVIRNMPEGTLSQFRPEDNWRSLDKLRASIKLAVFTALPAKFRQFDLSIRYRVAILISWLEIRILEAGDLQIGPLFVPLRLSLAGFVASAYSGFERGWVEYFRLDQSHWLLRRAVRRVSAPAVARVG